MGEENWVRVARECQAAAEVGMVGLYVPTWERLQGN